MSSLKHQSITDPAARQRVLDAFNVASLDELYEFIATQEADGHTPRNGDWAWDDPQERYVHQFDQQSLTADLRAYLVDRADRYEPIAVYHANGSVRTTEPLTLLEAGLISFPPGDAVEQQCYLNAQRIADENLQYVEGFMTCPQHPHPIPHAWVEVNGKVAELTFRGGGPEGAVYYGVPYSLTQVCTARIRRKLAQALATEPTIYRPTTE